MIKGEKQTATTKKHYTYIKDMFQYSTIYSWRRKFIFFLLSKIICLSAGEEIRSFVFAYEIVSCLLKEKWLTFSITIATRPQLTFL